MAFGKISRDLAVPQDSTAEYAFYSLYLCDAGPPKLTIRHAGDGTSAYKRAEWRLINEGRQQRAGDKRISEAKTIKNLIDEAKLIADHCAVSWVNVYEDGATTPAPCTPAKVHEFLTAIIEATDGITTYIAFRAWATDADNFRPAPAGDAAELGKA